MKIINTCIKVLPMQQIPRLPIGHRLARPTTASICAFSIKKKNLAKNYTHIGVYVQGRSIKKVK